MAAHRADRTTHDAKRAVTFFLLVLAGSPDFFMIRVTGDLIADKVAEKPLEDQRVTFPVIRQVSTCAAIRPVFLA